MIEHHVLGYKVKATPNWSTDRATHPAIEGIVLAAECIPNSGYMFLLRSGVKFIQVSMSSYDIEVL